MLYPWAAGDYKACLFCHHVKKTQKSQIQQKTHPTGYETDSDFLLKIVEQDWFQLLMCDKFESSTVNRKKLLRFEFSTR